MTVARSSWHALLPSAMVGSERKRAVFGDGGGAVAAFAAEAAHGEERAATQLLRAAAVIATCGLAGAQGRAWTAGLAKPAGSETRAALDDVVFDVRAADALASEHARLHAELFARLAQANLLLPTTLLPRALDIGRRTVAMRPALAEVIGERGRWLAAQNDDWRYATGVADDAGDEARWHDGSLEQRRAFLRSERERDAAAARQRLSEALAEMPVKERVELVSELATRLSAEDEALLDSLRADRGREVRAVALSLLLRLPAAAHTQRAIARLAPLLSEERQLLRKRWRIEPPTAPDKAWAADNVDAARPKSETLGERAWWLYQLVRQVPLAWWTTHTGMDADELIRWARSGDWAEALLRGWHDVLTTVPSVEWCQALLADKETQKRPGTVTQLLALLPRDLREAHWIRQLKDAGTELYQLLSFILMSHGPAETMSIELSAQVLDTLGPLAQNRYLHDHSGLRYLLTDIACCIDASALRQLDRLPYASDESPSFTTLRHAVNDIVAIRRSFIPINLTSTT